MLVNLMWQIDQIENGDIHVHPLDDKREHELDVSCPCEPTVELEGANLIIIHNAWDFREIAEELNKHGGSDVGISLNR